MSHSSNLPPGCTSADGGIDHALETALENLTEAIDDPEVASALQTLCQPIEEIMREQFHQGELNSRMELHRFGENVELYGSGVLAEVLAERIRQDCKWGGPEHDDQHELTAFSEKIFHRLAREDPVTTQQYKEVRKHTIEIAALAVAAIQSLDRRLAGKT